MIRGTTPTMVLQTEKDWTGWNVWVTFEEDDVELTFKDDRVTVEGSTIYVTLTQEETLQFQKKVDVQVKGKKDGIVEATLKSREKVYEILNEKVM